MTMIHELLAAGRTRSLEFFPPRTEAGRDVLRATLGGLAGVDPSFVSVTYGAGGSTRELTRDLVVELNSAATMPAMPHLTCVGHTRAQLAAMVDDYTSHGIDNVLALAGDPPADGSPAVGDFTFALELVEVLREAGSFSIGVAAFPEGHPRSGSLAEDRRHLAAKLELADFAITNFFFRAEDYLRLVDDMAALGVTKPIIPGVIPLLDPVGVRRFADLNGAWFPEDLASRIEAAAPAERLALAVEHSVTLCARLADEGAPGLHLYCMNRIEAPEKISALSD